MKSKILFEKKYLLNETTGIIASKRYLDTDFETHTHDFFEIEFIVSGSALHTVNGYTYEIKKGDIYLLLPSDFHSLKITEPLEYINIMYSEQSVSTSLLYEFITAGAPAFCRLSDTEYKLYMPVFELAAYESKAIGQWNIKYIKNLCECIMMTMLKKMKVSPHNLHSHRTIYKTILYINRNFRSHISLDELAAEAGLSKNYFCALFNRIFGIGAVEYINSIRLSYALNMLKSTDLPITHICFDSGFGSFSVFSRTFKKQYGYSPSSVRKT